MINLIEFQYKRNKKHTQYHLVFKSQKEYFYEEFIGQEDYYNIDINTAICCKIKVSTKYWNNFINNDLYHTIYIERDCLYINIIENSKDLDSMLKYGIKISQRILYYSCRAQININIPNTYIKNYPLLPEKHDRVLKTKLIKKVKTSINDIGITVIVLTDNRKCIHENHKIQDILAKIRISLNPTGEIVTYKILSAYCEICNMYFILKSDYKKIKQKGIILCPIIDKTQKHLAKANNKCLSGNESRIHQLGYNVIKGNGYTDNQRHVVLANIVENTDISKYEIISNLRRCISQHQNQPNYADSVKRWQNDLEFISDYELGDMPEVIVEKIIVGKRK